ncbi:ergosterol biosynthesis ERG4/ERG24 [Aspergillus insuetus]
MDSQLSYLLSPQTGKARGRLRKYQVQQDFFWGRRSSIAPLSGAAGAIALLIATPLTIIASCVAIQHFDGSILDMLSMLWLDGIGSFTNRYFPAPTLSSFIAYISWIAFQAALHMAIPGKVYTGQLTPGGNVLQYKINGLRTSIIVVVLFLLSGTAGLFDLSCIARSWPGILLASIIYGYLVSIVTYLKAHLAPSHVKDTRFSGSPIHDFFSGCELNPRWGRDWDIKLFHIGRPGMCGWMLIDISFAALQVQKHGSISNSMIAVLILHGIYIVDFFWNEDWYLRTIDIHHDHFGFYLAWGSTVWLPVLYSLQAQFLAYNHVQLSSINFTLTLILGLAGYTVFRSANNQKLSVRLMEGNCMVFGKKARVIKSTYRISDGSIHESLLLCSGWWGYARHANYTGDILIAFAFCACCGISHILPWTYFIYLTLLLINRCFRDEARCREKYGGHWERYCQIVRWRLCPGLF